jgi:hypothetical protein
MGHFWVWINSGRGELTSEGGLTFLPETLNQLCSAIIKYAVRIHPSNILRGLRYLADFKADWSSGEGQDAYVASGKRNEAEKILRELQTRSKTDYVSPYMIGVIHAGLGNKNKAFEFLESSYKEKSPDMAYFLKADLRLDSLRSDRRFQDLIKRMNFPN